MPTWLFEKARGDDRSRVESILLDHNPDAVIQGRYYMATENGEIKGVVGLLHRSWYMTEIRHLYVKPKYRRSGVGRFLVERALKKVKTPLVCCTVKEDNEGSMALFRGEGFTAERKFLNPETGHMVLLMARPIGPCYCAEIRKTYPGAVCDFCSGLRTVV